MLIHNDQSGIDTDEYSSTSSYSWTWDDFTDHSDEYNVFYHVNLIHDYFQDNFSYEWSEGSSTQMDAYVYVNSSSAYYSGGNIYFGINKYNSSDPSQRYYARCSDVIYHEYAHAVKDDIGANNNTSIDEGFSDYFACTITGESLYGECYHSGRQLYNNQYFYYYPDNITSSPHNNGTIIAGGAWDLRLDLGASAADELVFEGLCTLGTMATPHTFSDLVACILEADDDLNGDSNPVNGTPNQSSILEAFRYYHKIQLGLLKNK